MRVSGTQSPQCRLQGTVVSIIIVFVLDFFVFVIVNEFIIFSFLSIFVLVFVNENHTGPDLGLCPLLGFAKPFPLPLVDVHFIYGH